MSLRILLLAQAASTEEGGVTLASERIARAVREAGHECDVVELDSDEGVPSYSEAAEGGRTGGVRYRVRRFAVRSAKRLGIAGIARAVLAFARRVEIVVRRGAVLRAAQRACGLLLPSDGVPDGRLSSSTGARAVWEWHQRVVTATYSLPKVLLGDDRVREAAASIILEHHDQAYDVVVAPGLSPRVAATGYALSRILDVALVVDERWASESVATLPSPAKLMEERASHFATGFIDAVALERHLTGSEGASDPHDQVAGVIEDAVRTFEHRSLAYSPIHPVLTVVMEAGGDAEPLLRSLGALRDGTLPNWEVLVVADSSDPETSAIVRIAIDELGDSRIRVLETALESFELYSTEVLHAARADYFMRIRPGFVVKRDFVARAAIAILGNETAEGYYWTGSRLKANGERRFVVRGAAPLKPSLRDIDGWWYSLDGEYVVNWRMFNVLGGFSYLPPDTYTVGIEQILLMEAAAFRGTLYHAEVPLAYRRMSALSRNMPSVAEIMDSERDRVRPVPDSDDFIHDDEVSDDLKGRYSGKTVAFVRHALVAWDARLLKEASTLAGAGAHVVVAGVAETVPESMIERGFEVVVTSDKHDMASIRDRLAELRPDVVHAYDVTSYEMLESVLVNKSTKLVYECRDLHASLGYLPEDRRVLALARERELVERAAALVAVSEPVARWMESAYGIEGVVSILHGSATVVRDSTPPHDPVRLFFQGAFRPNRGLFAMISAMKRLQGRATMSFQGFSVMDNALHEYIRQLGLSDSMDFLPACGPLEVVQHAAQFDVGVISYAGTTENLLRAAPNKLMDYMSAGLAIVAPDLPGVRSITDETTGVFFRPGSAHDMADAIEGLIADREHLAACKAASLKRAKEHRWSVEQSKLLGIYDAVFEVEATTGTLIP